MNKKKLIEMDEAVYRYMLKSKRWAKADVEDWRTMRGLLLSKTAEEQIKSSLEDFRKGRYKRLA